MWRRASADTVVEAPAGTVYGVLADYRRHHPRIMPGALFSDLEVERGGIGAGTLFHVTLKVPGQARRLHMAVAEPEPGRRLTETDLDTGLLTTFVVEPAGEARTRVRLTTECDSVPAALAARLALTLQLRQLRNYLESDSFLAYSKGLGR